jgi:hypothetical protein
LKARVDFRGKVSNQHVRHACIMLSPGQVRKWSRATIPDRRLCRALAQVPVRDTPNVAERGTSGVRRPGPLRHRAALEPGG